MHRMKSATIIKRLGGPAAVAKLLGVDRRVVHNWIRRGIPPERKLARPDLFMSADDRRRVARGAK